MTRKISSLQNARVKNAVRLRQRRGRDRQGRILIDGRRETQRALDAHVPIVEVFVVGSRIDQDAELRELLARVQSRGAEVVDVTQPVFDRLSYGERHEGLVAIAEPRHVRLDELGPSSHALLAILEGIEKPGNVGAIARSADAVGLEALLLVDCHTDPFNPNAIRASVGTVFTRPIVQATRDEVLRWLADYQFQQVATEVGVDRAYDEISYLGRTAIIFGSEAHGLTKQWRGATSVSLPMQGVADSLNVSATAAILFYEALRQRRLAAQVSGTAPQSG